MSEPADAPPNEPSPTGRRVTRLARRAIEAFRTPGVPEALSVVALLLALWQTWLAVTAQREAHDQADDLRKIEESLSTRYLGEFPGYLPEITELIGRAEQRLDLFYDVPGYGEFSAPAPALAMRHTIERQAEAGRDVSVVLYSPERRREVIVEQFGYLRDGWTEWAASPDVKPRLERFLQKHGEPGETAASVAYEEYVRISLAAQQRVFEDDFERLGAELVDELMPLYFWIADRREAIFAIPAFSENASEIAFYTSDSRIIEALLEMRRRYVGRD